MLNKNTKLITNNSIIMKEYYLTKNLKTHTTKDKKDIQKYLTNQK
jgi:hypothetical protein